MQKNAYPIQNYVQISMGNCLFPDNFSFLSDVVSDIVVFLQTLS